MNSLFVVLATFWCTVRGAQVRFTGDAEEVGATGEAVDQRPNIIWLMADDLGYGEVGFNYNGPEDRRIATPNLDRLGQEGMRFRQAYSGYTVCAPSRTTFFTGRHVGSFWKHGLDGENIGPRQGKHTLAMLLKKAGYNTGAFGKISPLIDPLKTGFDKFVGQVDQNLCHNMFPKFLDAGYGKLNYFIGNDLLRASRETCLARPESFNYTIDVFHQEGIEWMESVLSDNKPFFLYMAYTVPHAGGWDDAPLDSTRGQPVPALFHYEHKPWPSVEIDHAASITYLDVKVGQLLGRLEDLEIDHNTLIFFASDNGAHVEGGHDGGFFYSSGGLRGQKRSLFEGGVRTPTMARWPAVIKPGATSDYAWAFWDVLPTLCEVAGAEIPLGIDGTSIAPTLRGENQSPKEYLFFSWRTRRSSNGVPDDGSKISLLSTKVVVHHAPKGDMKGKLGKKHKNLKDKKQKRLRRRLKASLLELQIDDGIADSRRHNRTLRQVRGGSKLTRNFRSKRTVRPTTRSNVMAYAVRSGDWKGVVPRCQEFTPTLDDDMALFDLKADPNELEDVSDDHPDVIQRLKTLVVSKNLSCGCFQCDWPSP